MDHDRLFKELLTNFFAEFIELFFPHIAAELDRGSIEFLDKEIFTDVSSGERHEVDLLAKARLHGTEAFFLVHVENQASADSDFPRRMFHYYARLDEKYRLPIYPIALFSYDRPLLPAPDFYESNLFGRAVVRFQFHAIQLNRLHWREFLERPNPVASALMTKMSIAPEDRPRVRLECLRMIATLRLDPARSFLIGVFMDSYLKLTAAEMTVYNREVRAVAPEQQEVIVQLVNEWVEEGRVEGLAKGLVAGRTEGRVEGRVELVLRLLRRRFGEVPAELQARVRSLSIAQLDALGDDLLDFQSLADAQAWVPHAS